VLEIGRGEKMDSPGGAIMKSKDDFQQVIEDQIIQSKNQIKDLMTALEQSQVEFNRLTQKKAAVTAQLQKIQTDLDGTTKEEIRDLFTQAMDSQQRLLIMRGQIEKNQIQLSSLNSMVDVLDQTREYLFNADKNLQTNQKTVANAEMVKMLVLAHEVERQRLSRQMHDGPAQTLSNFIVQAEIVSKLYDIDPLKAKDEIAKLKTASINTFHKIRTYIAELRPMSLDELGMVPALRKFLNMLKEQSRVEATLTISGNERKLDEFLEVFVFRSVQEIISDTIQRNQDTSTDLQVDIEIQFDSTQVQLSIQDNGKTPVTTITDIEDGVGLVTIKQRAELLGGVFVLSPSKEGTLITINVPLMMSAVN
jgi:two-component system, NarL family, sensor histidine kinase DegS